MTRLHAHTGPHGAPRLPVQPCHRRLLITLKETSAAIFYALLEQDLEALLPLVYTPTIGEACLAWGTLLPRPSGLYVSLARDRGRIAELLRCWPSDDVRIAVITDGQRILGLGDLGAHGAGIPAGKCIVHAAAGVPPSWLLPVTVDVGTGAPCARVRAHRACFATQADGCCCLRLPCNVTDNTLLRQSALYVGTPVARAQGDAYNELMSELVQCLQGRFAQPVLLHWEDLGAANAFGMLQLADAARIPTFSDDVQATAAAALAALLGAVQVPGVPPLTRQRWLFFGAGQVRAGAASPGCCCCCCCCLRHHTTYSTYRHACMHARAWHLLPLCRPTSGPRSCWSRPCSCRACRPQRRAHASG